MLLQSSTTYKIDSEYASDYTKLFPVCKVEIIQVTFNKVEVYHLFLKVDFCRFSAKCRK